MPDEKSKPPCAQVLVREDSLVVCRKGLLRSIGVREAQAAGLQSIGFRRWRVLGLAIHGCWVDEPEGVLLCEHDLVIALGLHAVFFQVVQALLEGVAGFGGFRVSPLVEGFVEMAVAGGGHETIVEEVAAFLAGEDIGLVVDVKDLEEEVGGSAGDTDEEETGRCILRGINGHGDYLVVYVCSKSSLGNENAQRWLHSRGRWRD